MGNRRVLLANPNLMRPPIAPIGLEYVADALRRHEFEPVLCDLTFADDWRAALEQATRDTLPLAVGFSIRNLDDAYFASQDFVLATTAEMIRYTREVCAAPVVLGGVGFSAAPREVLAFTEATYGVWGDGEPVFPLLLERLASGRDPCDLPNLVFRTGEGRVTANPPTPLPVHTLPTPSRRFLDHPRYFREGGQAGVETKRGCDHACIYCLDPPAKGKALRLREPESIVAEFADLVQQGVDVFHLCDAEYNLPPEHAHAVCEALRRSGVGDRIRWYTYACPVPFDAELARAMAGAGCAGINFGVDHADPTMLRRLGRGHTADDLRNTARACREAGLAAMFDLLLGGPGETRESLARAIEAMRDAAPDRVGLSCGVRVYPNTPLARLVAKQGPLGQNPNLHGATHDNADLLRPIFYVSEAIGDEIHRVVRSLVGDDPRFLAADPEEVSRNYNYNDNSVLAEAIRGGARGAYWDILRRLSG